MKSSLVEITNLNLTEVSTDNIFVEGDVKPTSVISLEDYSSYSSILNNTI